MGRLAVDKAKQITGFAEQISINKAQRCCESVKIQCFTASRRFENPFFNETGKKKS